MLRKDLIDTEKPRKDVIDEKKPRKDLISKKKPAPDDLLHEASILHPYAVASYTVNACFNFTFAPSTFYNLFKNIDNICYEC